MDGVAVSVWTSLRCINLSQADAGEVYFERFQRRGVQVPGEPTGKVLQRKRAGVGLDDVAAARLCGTFWEKRLTDDL